LQNRYSFFHKTDDEYLRFLIPEGSRIIELGCGNGRLLNALNPSVGVGVDSSSEVVTMARNLYPNVAFIEGDVEDKQIILKLISYGPFDVVLIDNTLGYLKDIQKFFQDIQGLLGYDTRIVSINHSHLWSPIVRGAGLLSRRRAVPRLTSLKMSDIENFMKLGNVEVVKREWRIISPYKIFGVGQLLNRYFATLPFIRKICLRQYLVARSTIVRPWQKPASVSVIVPCRNEKGNVESAIRRLPQFPGEVQIIFVEGHSEDGTWEEIERVKNAYPHVSISKLRQIGDGKGDAVRTGFDAATGDLLIILDADLTVPPEELIKFYDALMSGRGEYINGSRLIYNMEPGAMQFLNQLANHFFAKVFTFILNQEFTDTLCGTKAISRRNYENLKQNRDYFGDFDPFGDFDLIFGAAKLNLKFLEIPIRYVAREYGSTQISRFRHGILLIRMVAFAYSKLKVV